MKRKDAPGSIVKFDVKKSKQIDLNEEQKVLLKRIKEVFERLSLGEVS